MILPHLNQWNFICTLTLEIVFPFSTITACSKRSVILSDPFYNESHMNVWYIMSRKLWDDQSVPFHLSHSLCLSLVSLSPISLPLFLFPTMSLSWNWRLKRSTWGRETIRSMEKCTLFYQVTQSDCERDSIILNIDLIQSSVSQRHHIWNTDRDVPPILKHHNFKSSFTTQRMNFKPVSTCVHHHCGML